MTHKHFLSLISQMKIYSMIVHSKKSVLKIIEEFNDFFLTYLSAVMESLI